MKKFVKKSAIYTGNIIGAIFSVIPASVRLSMIKSILFIESRIGGPSKSLKQLFNVTDFTELLINERALAYGHGEHPKHRLMNYHQFFVENIPAGSHVLDAGCGYGAVANTVAAQLKDCQITAVDFNRNNINQALQTNALPNIEFICDDVFNVIDKKKNKGWDAVILSNIVEHIENRVDFLKKLESAGIKLFLIRVPVFERNWQIALRKELGINYFSDNTHYIEHKLQEFMQEVKESGLRLESYQIKWGEIWAVCCPGQA